MVECHN
jgi:hypothetical protein